MRNLAAKPSALSPTPAPGSSAADGSWSAPLPTKPRKVLRDGQSWAEFTYDPAARRIVVKGGDPRLHLWETVVRDQALDLDRK